MAYHIQSSFAAGELDPALHERTAFDKFKAGLAALRNAVVGKTGRIISRAGQLLYKATSLSNTKCVIFSPPYTKYLIEWGHLYVRIHDTEAGTYTEDAHTWTESDLDKIQFEPSGKYVYIFCEGKTMKKMVLGPLELTNPLLDTRFLSEDTIIGTNPEIFYSPRIPYDTALTSNTSGYLVDYCVTSVIDGQESFGSIVTNGSTISKLAMSATEKTEITIFCGPTKPTEVRVYRRPNNGSFAGAFGYIGSTSKFTLTSGNWYAQYQDIGFDADYTHGPPTLDFFAEPGLAPLVGPIQAKPKTGCVYQQRLLLTNYLNEEAINASRTGFHNNFNRDYPLSADSALTFKAGTSGNAKVLRLHDGGGLLAFTTAGIYQNSGVLSPSNLALEHKGNWVIEESVPPLKVPGGTLFVDKTTNTVRSLIYSNEAGGFPGEEVSIFSNHLFLNKKIKSWAFQDGDVPLVWVVFDDGSLTAMTYQREHQMQAWSRHDSDTGIYESVTVVKSLTGKSTVYFVVKRGTQRLIEYGSNRFVADLKELCLMDSAKTFNSLVHATAVFTVTPHTPGDWLGDLDLTSSVAAFANTAGSGAIGTVFRLFDQDGSAIDLTVKTYGTNQTVRVTASVDYPSSLNTGFKLYKTYSTLTGLDHLNGKKVSVLCDGYVIASPNNDVEQCADLTVTAGSLTLPNGLRGAFVHVGLPFTVDVETLDVDTVEQKPTLLESDLVNKVYLKIYNSRGTFIGSKFPDNDKVAGMVDVEERTEDFEDGNIGNAAQKLETKRHYLAIPNDWQSRGRVCIRQVDPLPFEILSIIPDLTILYP